ncbi:cis-prenyltransferase [Savitreella phatthalungensis]
MGNSWNWLLSFPPLQWAKTHIEGRLIDALRCGPIPAHVALVMDGNRRYARKMRLETVEGHALGFESLKGILEVCYKAGVRYVTIYAFSIENFKRSKHEVEVLMDMAKNNLLELCQHGDVAEQYGVRISVLGRRDLLGDDVRKVVEQAEDITRGNKRAMLNICFPYTSRDEITTAVASLVEDSERGQLSTEQIERLGVQDFEARLMTAGTPPPDIWIRTSGVERLSDFLLWQSCSPTTTIKFVEAFWPDFDLWTLLPIVVEWQIGQLHRHHSGIFSWYKS